MTDDERQHLELLASDPDPLVRDPNYGDGDVPSSIFHEFRAACDALDDYKEALYDLEDAATTLLLEGDS